ncbi:SRPBCC domain-containing protein [Micromonospora sp. NPDC049679]|uniref:SRPBCC family protein n=1 Tax=Micromonospora sp. NPDC049679 TaxID=3155920 RepID=UPI0033CFD2EF
MGREFEVRKEVALDATPEQVWDAIATGPGITSWFMTHEVEPREGGTVRLCVGDFTAESTVTAWEPPRRFAVRGEEAPDGTVHAFEYLIEGREGGSTVLRFVHHGFLSDDWGAEYEGQTSQGWDMYLHTLGQYVTHFTGRAATYVNAEGPQVAPGKNAWDTATRGLGLPGEVAQGKRVRLTPQGLAPIEGVVDYVGPTFLGVRTNDALYRFHGRPDSVGVGHHLFDAGVEQKEADLAWQSWLNRVFA